MDGNGKAVQRLGRDEWQAVIDRQQSSGQSAPAYCREHGISIWQFRYWRKRLSASAVEGSGFTRVCVTGQSSAVQLWIEAGQWRVGIGTGFDETTLRRVLSVMGSP